MTVCVVTDRHRFDPPIEGLLRMAREAVAAGVDLIQIRERDLQAIDLAAVVGAVIGLARGTTTRVVVNDRLDVALACGADGVHLRADSIGVTDARRISPAGFLIGRSVHNVDELSDAVGADYLIAGTVYPTSSKPGAAQFLGRDGLRSIVRDAAAPVLAIGGVTLDRIAEVAGTGAAGVAAIGLFASTPIAGIVAEIRRQFDTAKPAP